MRLQPNQPASNSRCCKTAQAVLMLIVVGCAAAPTAAAAGIVRLFVEGEPQTVFAGRSERCDALDVPDAPARAFRDADGLVHLFATHFDNRASVGPDLDHVARDCRVVFRGRAADDPAMFDDRLWLAAVHSTDGRTVHALVHAEYHGHRRPDRCPAGRYMACWWNAVIQVRSEDGGRSFQRLPEGGLVAALPYAYDGVHGKPAGYFNPSNIIAHQGFLYAFVFAGDYGAQRRGACLLRTSAIEDPAAWRAWDGEDFRVRFIDPYRSRGADASAHVCTPVPGVASPISSIVRLNGIGSEDGGFVALTSAAYPMVPGGEAVPGVYFLTSPDLVHWSAPRLLIALPMMFKVPCTAPFVYGYPALLDPESPSRTFETVGARAHLYLTRFVVPNCRLSMDRDLVRFRVIIDADAGTVAPK